MLSGFELYPRWVPLVIDSISGRSRPTKVFVIRIKLYRESWI